MEMEILNREKVDEQKPKQYKHSFYFSQEQVGGEFVSGKTQINLLQT